MRRRALTPGLLLALLWPAAARAADTHDHAQATHEPRVVRLHDALESISLGPYLDHAYAAPDLAAADTRALAWHASHHDSLNLGFTPRDVWVRFRVHNQSSHERFLVRVAFALLDRIELYEAPDRLLVVTGLQMPFATRPVRARDFVLPVDIPQGAEREFLVRVRSRDAVQLPMTLWRPDAYHAAARLETWGLGLYYGIALVMIAYNLVLFLSIRDRSYLYYVAHITAFCGFMLSQQGLAYEFLWPGWPWWAHIANPLLGGISLLVAGQFARAFLDLRDNAPRLDRVVSVIQLLCLVHIVLAPFVPFALAATELASITVVFIITATVSSVVCLRRGFAAARLYLLAFVTLFIGTTAYALKTLGFLPTTFVTNYGLLIGSAAEIVLLSLALADRINQLKRERERERAQAFASRLRLLDSFARFVPHQFLDELDRDSIEDVVRGDAVEREMTILFADIRGFTSMAERMSSAETFQFLNSYLEAMSPPIHRNHGFVDKFVGDGIMALFPGSADDALAAALELMRALREWNAAQKLPVRIGVGLNRGRIMLGTVGSPGRLDTTVVGDAVNLASRVENLTKLYQASVILTDTVHDALQRKGAFRLRELDAVRVRGKQKPVMLYQAYDAEEPELMSGLDATLDMYSEALALYRAGRFAGAEAAFGQCLERCPGDAVVTLYIERCRTYARTPPPDWQGISQLDEKRTPTST